MPLNGYVVVVVPLAPKRKQVLLGLRLEEGGPLRRFAAHELFEPRVMLIVAAFQSGKASGAFEQLQREVSS